MDILLTIFNWFLFLFVLAGTIACVFQIFLDDDVDDRSYIELPYATTVFLVLTLVFFTDCFPGAIPDFTAWVDTNFIWVFWTIMWVVWLGLLCDFIANRKRKAHTQAQLNALKQINDRWGDK